MFDFLNSKLSPKVRCTSAAMDGYEAENLISPNDLTRSRGFLAYTSIKPPVDIDFELICPISLNYVFVLTTVGTQKTNGVELLAKNKKTDEFVSIAKAFFSNTKEGIFFCNSRIFSLSSPPPNYSGRFYLCFLKSDTFRVFINASEVRVRILRTERSVPCLGKVEIWGRVSKMCSETTACTIKRIMQPPVKNSNDDCNNAKSVIGGLSNRIAKFDIPEEFKDALTYEIMAIPMTLPSGSTVDKTTIEKFTENEASYGRQPSDPFTGLKFTESRKPVLNTALKSRIDMFLIKHADVPETYNASRTVGRSTARDQQLFSETKNANAKRKIDDCDKSVDSKIRKGADGYDDLNALIQRTLSSQNFIRFTGEECAQQNNVKLSCVVCEITKDLYILPCNHLYCRKCLMNVCIELNCKNCNSTFSRADPKKFHPV